MERKLINKQIRKVSNFTTLPVLVFIVLRFVVLNVVSALLAALVDRGVEINKSVQIIILYVALYVLVGGISLLVFYLTRKKATGLLLSQVFRKPQKSAGWVFKWFVIALAFTYIANFITTYARYAFESLTGMELNTPSFNFGDSAIGVFGMFLSVSVLAPVVEELFFRGTIYRNAEVMGQFFAIIFSGLIFGLWHTNYQQFLYTMVMGSFMAFIFAKTRSILPTMLFHFAMNTFSTVLMLIYNNLGINPDTDIDSLMQSTDSVRTLSQHPAFVIFMLLIVLLVLGILHAGVALFIVQLVKNRRKKKFMGSVFPVSASRRIGTFLSAPITIITLALLIFETVYNAIP